MLVQIKNLIVSLKKRRKTKIQCYQVTLVKFITVPIDAQSRKEAEKQAKLKDVNGEFDDLWNNEKAGVIDSEKEN